MLCHVALYGSKGARLFVNPDLWMFFELEEQTAGSGIWKDPKLGKEVLIQHQIDKGNLEVVEIRPDYLLKYLQARQNSLVIGHYRHLHFYDPPQAAIDAFNEEDIVLGSRNLGAKAIFQNWGLRNDIPGTAPFLQRRLHLWFEIKPPDINVEDPLAKEPPFDPYAFTFPTSVGSVAPARWSSLLESDEHKFKGKTCDFMDRIYFQQEVLLKYERLGGFKVADDGSVSCQHYWGLTRSTTRLGNELLSTAIGDFAQGVPFEEWPHWKQYSVEPPNPKTAKSLQQEGTIPEVVNSLVNELSKLNYTFSNVMRLFGVNAQELLWGGTLDSLAGRQLKGVYPADSDDDEFLKRATLLSTLVIEEFKPDLLRKVICSVGNNLHLNDETPPRPFGSRNLVQRLVLICVLIDKFRPEPSSIPILIQQAEGKEENINDPELQNELKAVNREVRDSISPLAFLYDLRTHGGLAHAFNRARISKAANYLGLPKENWHRKDYLHLLKLATSSIQQINEKMENITRMMT